MTSSKISDEITRNLTIFRLLSFRYNRYLSNLAKQHSSNPSVTKGETIIFNLVSSLFGHSMAALILQIRCIILSSGRHKSSFCLAGNVSTNNVLFSAFRHISIWKCSSQFDNNVICGARDEKNMTFDLTPKILLYLWQFATRCNEAIAIPAAPFINID